MLGCGIVKEKDEAAIAGAQFDTPRSADCVLRAPAAATWPIRPLDIALSFGGYSIAAAGSARSGTQPRSGDSVPGA